MPPEHGQPWWERRAPSSLVFVVVLAIAGLLTLALGVRLRGALPDVGRDRAGIDPWTDPVGIEQTKAGFLIAHLPGCAQAPVVRIILWDDNSQPLWEVAGPQLPLESFVLGALPKGFHTVHPLRAPGRDQMVRIVVIRRLMGVAGGRYKQSALRSGKVVTLDATKQHVYTVDGFKGLDLCPAPGEKPADAGVVGTTTPSGTG
ncbi:MAG: hypothetical protein JWM05_3069 [Acidimicrobiales bacterium]|nr:hypothetical protein [Acidimicrobiales bacterium]